MGKKKCTLVCISSQQILTECLPAHRIMLGALENMSNAKMDPDSLSGREQVNRKLQSNAIW